MTTCVSTKSNIVCPVVNVTSTGPFVEANGSMMIGPGLSSRIPTGKRTLGHTIGAVGIKVKVEVVHVILVLVVALVLVTIVVLILLLVLILLELRLLALLVLVVLLLLLVKLVVVKEVKVLSLLEESVTVDTGRLVEELAIIDVEMVVLRGSVPVVKGNVVGKLLGTAGGNSK